MAILLNADTMRQPLVFSLDKPAQFMTWRCHQIPCMEQRSCLKKFSNFLICLVVQSPQFTGIKSSTESTIYTHKNAKVHYQLCYLVYVILVRESSKYLVCFVDSSINFPSQVAIVDGGTSHTFASRIPSVMIIVGIWYNLVEQFSFSKIKRFAGLIRHGSRVQSLLKKLAVDLCLNSETTKINEHSPNVTANYSTYLNTYNRQNYIFTDK